MTCKMAKIRKSLKMSQKDLANACGFKSPSRIGMYEVGSRSPTLKGAKEIVDAFNKAGYECTVDSVFYEDINT